MKNNKGRIKAEDSLINFLPKDQKDFFKKNESKIDQEVKSSGNLKELLEDIKQVKNGKIKNVKRLKKRPSEQALKDKVNNNKLKFEKEKMTLSNEINKDNFKEKVESKPICDYKLKNILYQEIQLLSPVYEYYKGIDSLLKEEFKEYFNYDKSNNFIKKSYIMENYKDKVENKDDKFNNNKYNKNGIIEKGEKELNIEFNDVNNPKYNNYYIYNNKFEEPFQKKNIQINDYNNYYYDKNNYNNRYIKEKYYNYNNSKYKTGLKIQRSRKNWTCLYCNNYNYYFRNSCYICNALNPNI